MSKEITNIFNKLASQEEEKASISNLREYAKKAKTKVLKDYISNRTNEEWDIKCSIANDELIKRG